MRDGGAGVAHSLFLHRKCMSKTTRLQIHVSDTAKKKSQDCLSLEFDSANVVGSAIFRMQGAEGCGFAKRTDLFEIIAWCQGGEW